VIVRRALVVACGSCHFDLVVGWLVTAKNLKYDTTFFDASNYTNMESTPRPVLTPTMVYQHGVLLTKNQVSVSTQAMSASPTKRPRIESPTESPNDEKHSSISTIVPNGMIDARGCVVVMCAAEEGDSYEWYVVPLAKFNEDISPIAKRNDWKGESMIEYMMQVAPCTPDGYGEIQWGSTLRQPSIESKSEGDMMHKQFEKWQKELGENKGFFQQRIAHMFSPVCTISVDIHE